MEKKITKDMTFAELMELDSEAGVKLAERGLFCGGCGLLRSSKGGRRFADKTIAPARPLECLPCDSEKSSPLLLWRLQGGNRRYCDRRHGACR